jgi:hypothetical protein
VFPPGWQLLLLEAGVAAPIKLERFQDVIVYWAEFSKRYLSDLPTLPRAA